MRHRAGGVSVEGRRDGASGRDVFDRATLSQQYVTVEWMDGELGVPLEQLEPIDASDDTEQAIADWQYWLEK